jgi:hypothetical protein
MKKTHIETGWAIQLKSDFWDLMTLDIGLFAFGRIGQICDLWSDFEKRRVKKVWQPFLICCLMVCSEPTSALCECIHLSHPKAGKEGASPLKRIVPGVPET